MTIGSPFRNQPLALLYLVLAFPVVLFQVFATPPFQMPDEPHHFMRALQIADGQILAQRFGETVAGGLLESAAQDAAVAFKPLAHDLAQRLDLTLLARVASLRWGGTAKTPANFDNTAIYPPTLYLPGAVGLKVGKMLGWSILRSYYLARLITGLCSLGLATVALGLCRKGRGLLFILLSLPFTLSAFASVSQDALAIASGAIAIATWSLYLDRNQDVPMAARAGVALLIGTVAAARLPLFPLFGLLLLPTERGRPWWPRRSDLAAASVGLFPVVLGLVCAASAKIAFRPEDGVDSAGQITFLLHHPIAAFPVIGVTIAHSLGEFFREMVTVLGWWNGMVPPSYYDWIFCGLAVVVVLESLSSSRALPFAAALVQLGLVAVACIGVFLALYVAWTPVGAPSVEGVQGRYFFVPVLFCIVVLPTIRPFRLRGSTSGWDNLVARTQTVLCAAVGLCNLWSVPMTILQRYYL